MGIIKPTMQCCYRYILSMKNPQYAMLHIINVQQMVISNYGSADLVLMSLKKSFWKQECIIVILDQSKPKYTVRELTD